MLALDERLLHSEQLNYRILKLNICPHRMCIMQCCNLFILLDWDDFKLLCLNWTSLFLTRNKTAKTTHNVSVFYLQFNKNSIWKLPDAFLNKPKKKIFIRITAIKSLCAADNCLFACFLLKSLFTITIIFSSLHRFSTPQNIQHSSQKKHLGVLIILRLIYNISNTFLFEVLMSQNIKYVFCSVLCRETQH